MIKIPVSKKVRKKIIGWLEKKVKYEDIIKYVEKEGESISKGGITYIKYQEFSKKTKQAKQEKKENPRVQDTKKEKKSEFTNALELHEEQIKTELYNTGKLLTELEFNLFEKSFETVYNSNLTRLLNAKAHGILNSLNNLKKIIAIIKKRGKY